MAIILFDGVCNLCNGSVQWIIKRDVREHFTFASLQSEVGQKLLAEYDIKETDSFVLIKGGQHDIKSSAALQVCKSLPWPWPLLFGMVVIPKPIRDLGYDLIAKNRYKWFGKSESCTLPTAKKKKRFLD